MPVGYSKLKYRNIKVLGGKIWLAVDERNKFIKNKL